MRSAFWSMLAISVLGESRLPLRRKTWSSLAGFGREPKAAPCILKGSFRCPKMADSNNSSWTYVWPRKPARRFPHRISERPALRNLRFRGRVSSVPGAIMEVADHGGASAEAASDATRDREPQGLARSRVDRDAAEGSKRVCGRVCGYWEQHRAPGRS